MADDQQQLSPEDLQDLKDIATKLPAGHPMQGKISLLLNQPAKPEPGFWGTIKSKLGSLIPSSEQWAAESAAPQPQTQQDLWKRNRLIRSETEAVPGQLAGAIKTQATRPLPPDLNNPLYRAATTLSSLVPGLNPEASERASSRGDTGAVWAENALPAAAAVLPMAGRYAAKVTLPARTSLAQKLVSPLVHEGLGEAAADTRLGIQPDRALIREGIWGTKGSMAQQLADRTGQLKTAANNVLQTAPGAGTRINAGSAINSAMDDAIQTARGDGSPGVEPRLENLRQALLSEHGSVTGSPIDINKLKTNVQGVANRLGAYKNTVPAEASAGAAAGRAASNIRSQVNAAVPEATQLNERMADAMDARDGLKRSILADKGKDLFSGDLWSIPNKLIQRTVASPLVRSGAARFLTLGSKLDVPTELAIPGPAPLATGPGGPPPSVSSKYSTEGPASNPNAVGARGTSGTRFAPHGLLPAPPLEGSVGVLPSLSGPATNPMWGTPETSSPSPSWGSPNQELLGKWGSGYEPPQPPTYHPKLRAVLSQHAPSWLSESSQVAPPHSPPVPSDGAPTPSPSTRPPSPAGAEAAPKTMPYPGPERRTVGDGYRGPERRTFLPGVTTEYDLPTAGEKLGADIRAARAGTKHNLVEGDAIREIMHNATEYERFKSVDAKEQAKMLVAAKNRILTRMSAGVAQ